MIMGIRILHFMLSITVLLLITVTLFTETALANKVDPYINYSDELSNRHVKSIFQDSNGFMWFGTKNKLNRFDGNMIRHFDCYDPHKEVRDNNINAISEDTSHRLWLGTDNGVFIFSLKQETFTFFDLKTKDGERIEQWVSDINYDRYQHNIWITVPNQGVFRYNLLTMKLSLYKVVPTFKLGISHAECLFIDSLGNVWVGSNGSGVFLYNPKIDGFEQFLGDNNGQDSLIGKNIYSLQRYQDKLVLGIHNGPLMILDISTNSLSRILFPEIRNSIIRDIKVDRNILWIGTQDGLFSTSLEVKNKHTRVLTSYTLNDKFIEDILIDHEGALWVATKFGGVNYMSHFGIKFNVYKPSVQLGDKVSNRIRNIVESQKGDLWLGTEDSGILGFNIANARFTNLSAPSGHKTPETIFYTEGNLWAGYFQGGLDIFNPYTGGGNNHSIKEFGMEEGGIFVLYEDRSGTIWMGNGWGVFTRKKGQLNWYKMSAFGSCFVKDIYQDKEGFIWLATMGSGAFRYNPISMELKQFLMGTGEGLPTNLLNGVSEDQEGQIWFSTDRSGICSYHKNENHFRTYSIKEGLPDDIAFKILADKQNNLWFGTNRGLVNFNPITKRIAVFTTRDGLPSNSFNLNSAIISRDDTFYMGTLDGLISFKPEGFAKNVFVPPIYITQIQISGADMDEFSDLNKGLHFRKLLKLTDQQNNISLFFSSLSYAVPNANRYAYILEGVDKDWVFTQNNHSVSYANLKPGIYKFRVKGTNNDGIWSAERTLTIQIVPPWWASDVAYVIYVFLFLAAGLYGLEFVDKKRLREQKNQQRQFEAQKERELYEAKINFFTEIAHEIRTPVSLINGPLESIIDNGIDGPRVQENLKIMQRNGKLLIGLVDQLLDFRKIDAERFIINTTVLNVNDLIRSVLARFEAIMLDKKINFSWVNCIEEDFLLEVDKEGLEKIVNNMVSNSIKYGINTIVISSDCKDDNFQFRILNDGPTIEDRLQDRIFEPFFRVKINNQQVPGSGLGLSLSRALAELMQGTLQYVVEEGFNCFYLAIPINNKKCGQLGQVQSYIPEVDNISRTKNEEESLVDLLIPKNDSSKLTLLIVEDNIDLLNFIKSELSIIFNIEVVVNAEDALMLLAHRRFHIVLSDIMMMEMDGITLCQKIKADPQMNHTIVVLMTARNDLKSKLKALEVGADAYLEKPFAVRYLVSLLDSLVKNRNQVISNIAKDPLFGIQSANLSKSDRLFLEKLINVIHANLMDTKFGIEKLAELLNCSRSSLYRRLKSISDYSPVELIRLVRLYRAVDLLKQGEYRIGEIVYLVGISSPSYFVKLFQAQFHMSPREFRDSLKEFNS